MREDFDGGGDIAFCEDVAIHDVATLLKEFFRDLPEPLFPKDLLPGLLAVQSKCDGSSLDFDLLILIGYFVYKILKILYVNNCFRSKGWIRLTRYL